MTQVKKPRWSIFLTVLVLQITLYLSSYLGLTDVVGIVGLVYLVFVPGYLITKLLKFDELDPWETLLYSVAFSIAYLMLAGLIANELLYLFGISEPLSYTPLSIIVNFPLLFGAMIYSFRSGKSGLKHSSALTEKYLNKRNIGLIIPVAVLPILAVVGATWMNIYGNNSILIFMLLIISTILVIVSMKKSPPLIYPFTVFCFGVSLLFHSSWISNFLVPFASDIPLEYFVFKTTLSNSHWVSQSFDLAYGRINDMLSTTILPTVFSTMLSVEPTWVLKIIIPLIFSFVPLGVYFIWKGYLGSRFSFLAVFLFVAQSTFYTELLALSRQMIAELFFVVLLLVIVTGKLTSRQKAVSFAILGFALVASHYAIAEIFYFFIVASYVVLRAIKKPSRNISSYMIILFFVLMFSWYIFTSNSSVFQSSYEFATYIQEQFGDFFNPASRGVTVLRGLGLEAAPTIWNAISRIFAYLTQALIIIGFVGLVTRRDRFQFDRVSLAFIVIGISLLASLLIFPGLANTLNMTRFYHVLLIVLSPLAIIGVKFLSEKITKRKNEIQIVVVLLVILVPYFLFQSSLIYEMTGSGVYSVSLSKNRMSPLYLYGTIGYTDSCSVFGATWLSSYAVINSPRLYADSASRYGVLTDYGLIYRENILTVSNSSILPENALLFFTTLNVKYGLVPAYGLVYNYSQLDYIDGISKIYANGESEIFRNP